MRLDDIARRVDDAGTDLASAAGAYADLDPGAEAFGAGAGGRLGELGRSLHRRTAMALDARRHEAGTHAERLAELAVAVRGAAKGYGEVDREAGERHTGEQ